MLRKPSLHRALQNSRDGELYKHYKRVMKIRLNFMGLHLPGTEKDEICMPECHHVSHAYAKAFGVEVIDGEKVFLTKSKTWLFGHFVTGKVSRYAHSWNVIELAGDMKLVIDIIPDETCSMSPIIVEYPHPAYTEPRDGVAKRCITEYVTREEEQEVIDLLAKEFKRITTQ